jgi:hypothetical protein
MIQFVAIDTNGALHGLRSGQPILGHGFERVFAITDAVTDVDDPWIKEALTPRLMPGVQIQWV